MTVSYSEYVKQQQITSVRLAKNTNLSGTYSNGTLNNGVGATFTVSASSLTIDSVVCNLGDRVLLFAQTSGYQNGIYVVSAVGAAVVLTRSSDFQTFDQMKTGYFIPVSAGTLLNGSVFVVVEPQVAVIGASSIIFANVSLGGIKRGTTATFGGGSTSNAFSAPGVLSTDIVTASISASANSVAIAKIVPTTDTLTVTFTADPGAGTVVKWVAVPA